MKFSGYFLKSVFIIYFILFFTLNAFADYSKIDRHVMNTPSEVEQDIDKLAAYLVQPALSDKEKIRAIFRWVTENITYDVQIYLSRIHKTRTPQQILKDRSCVCDGYAALMVGLGRSAGLEIESIIGYSKGYDYKIGDKFPNGPNHAWNAVKLDGQWQLLDATWGAGYIDENNHFIRRFQEHYFLTSPQSFLLDHLPEQQRWQLVDDPISLKEFEDNLYLRPAYFEYGLSVKSHYQNTIKIYDDTKVEFYAPDNVAMAAQLYQNESPLPDYLTFCQRKSGQYAVYVQTPKSGKYILRLYAGKNKKSHKYDWIMDYSLFASGGKGGQAGFPVSYATFNDIDAYLFEPVKRYLDAGKDYKLKLFVPGAIDVSVKMNDQWTPLKSKGDLFEDYITVRSGTVQVLAKFNDSGNTYKALLNYIGR